MDLHFAMNANQKNKNALDIFRAVWNKYKRAPHTRTRTLKTDRKHLCFSVRQFEMYFVAVADIYVSFMSHRLPVGRFTILSAIFVFFFVRQQLQLLCRRIYFLRRREKPNSMRPHARTYWAKCTVSHVAENRIVFLSALPLCVDARGGENSTCELFVQQKRVPKSL